MKHLVVAAMIGLSAVAGLGQPAMAMPLSALLNRALHGEAQTGQTQPLVQVQASEAGRVGQLEEQIRSLNGRIEEMSFQLLQMQEQIRKFQEDNEFRFQDLEGGKSGATQKNGALETPKTSDQATATPPASDDQVVANRSQHRFGIGTPRQRRRHRRLARSSSMKTAIR